MNVSARLGNRRLAQVPETEALGMGRLVLLLLLWTAAALFYAFTSVAGQNLSYTLSRELETQREVIEVQRQLKVELGILQAPERLEREAARLGLAAPGPGQVRTLK